MTNSHVIDLPLWNPLSNSLWTLRGALPDLEKRACPILMCESEVSLWCRISIVIGKMSWKTIRMLTTVLSRSFSNKVSPAGTVKLLMLTVVQATAAVTSGIRCNEDAVIQERLKWSIPDIELMVPVQSLEAYPETASTRRLRSAVHIVSENGALRSLKVLDIRTYEIGWRPRVGLLHMTPYQVRHSSLERLMSGSHDCP